MKKKIAIFGSTGSIGQSLLEIVSKDKKNFEIVLLTAQKNYKKLYSDAKKFKVKNLIITDVKSYKILKSLTLNSKIKIYNDFNYLNKIFKKKIDYIMSSITGIDGLYPTFKCIKYTKKIAIANKETIICGWKLIDKELKKNKTEFIPVDSEHFSLWFAIKSFKKIKIEKIYLTASGGPLLNTPLSKMKNIKISHALNHPKWKMGKKISIDSSTLMNKVFEVIEAKHIFNLKYNQISILTHPDSYVHAIVKFSNGLIKIIAHDTTMKIPIFNTLYNDEIKKIKSNPFNINKFNNLNFKKVNNKTFPCINILKKIPENISLYETVLVAANDKLVEFFLNKKIKYNQISDIMFKLINNKVFVKYKKIVPKKIQDIIFVKNHVNLYLKKKLKYNNV